MSVEVRRLVAHNVQFSDQWEKHQITKSSATFILSDEEFDFLINLPREYQYHEFDNEFYIDRHPSILEEGISNIDFIEDYKNHMSDKFFVLYEFRRLEDV